MTTTELSPGIYNIAVASLGAVERRLLTRHGKDEVSVISPGAEPDPAQEWAITRSSQDPDNIIIARPSTLFPTSYLTYKGVPEKPKEGDRVEESPVCEFPPNEWHPKISLGCYLLRVAGSDFGIRLGEELINPPFLKLGLKDQLEWRFERVRDE